MKTHLSQEKSSPSKANANQSFFMHEDGMDDLSQLSSLNPPALSFRLAEKSDGVGYNKLPPILQRKKFQKEKKRDFSIWYGMNQQIVIFNPNGGVYFDGVANIYNRLPGPETAEGSVLQIYAPRIQFVAPGTYDESKGGGETFEQKEVKVDNGRKSFHSSRHPYFYFRIRIPENLSNMYATQGWALRIDGQYWVYGRIREEYDFIGHKTDK